MEIEVLNKTWGRRITIIDDDDYDKIKNYKLYLFIRKYGTIYEYINIRINDNMIGLHRFIVDCPKDMVVDHINHNTLDNRKSNLRICTRQENSRNSLKHKELTSKYKGVSFDSKKKLYRVQISINKQSKKYGWFKNEIDAAKKYNDIVSCIYGDFALLNKI